jgi:iduronate 2-sulfatase
MDAQVGRVLDELDRLELANNTIIVLWGDHGWHLGDHGMWCKHTNYEQAAHAPLLFVAPKQPGEQRERGIVEFVDIYPTLCDLAGLERAPHLQGDSLAGSITGISSNDRTQTTDGFALHVYPRRAQPYGALLGHALRTDRWRYVEWQKQDGAIVARELYDLDTDPDETVNLAGQSNYEAVVSEHSALVRAQLEKPDPAGLKRA